MGRRRNHDDYHKLVLIRRQLVAPHRDDNRSSVWFAVLEKGKRFPGRVHWIRCLWICHANGHNIEGGANSSYREFGPCSTDGGIFDWYPLSASWIRNTVGDT